MPKAVLYGAGSVGRGYMAQLFSLSGYDLFFIDIDTTLVQRLNDAGGYPLCTTDGKKETVTQIRVVRTVDGNDSDAVALELCDADIMAIAVSENALSSIAPNLAAGLCRRWHMGNTSALNMLVCQETPDADLFLRQVVQQAIPVNQRPLLAKRTGFVECCADCMALAFADTSDALSPLRVVMEPLCTLHTNAECFVGPLPKIRFMQPHAPFTLYRKRKLFIDNMGQSMAAYLGWLYGVNYLYESMEIPAIKTLVRQSMMESALALQTEFHAHDGELQEHVDKLLQRLQNPHLTESVTVLGKDPAAKLANGDRFLGAVSNCLQNGVTPSALCVGVAAVMRYSPSEDPQALAFHTKLTGQGQEAFLSACEDLHHPRGEVVRSAILAAERALALMPGAFEV